MRQGGEPQGVQVVRQGEPTPYHCNFNRLYINSLPQYWHIGGSLAEFRCDLPRHIGKIGELGRIQLNEYADLKAILPVLWEEVLQHHPSSPRFQAA